MDELRSDYIRGLSERVDALTAIVQKNSVLGGEDREAVRKLSHSLKGSGGTYGFPEISEAAALVEESSESNISKASDDLIQLLNRIISEHQASQ